VQDRIGNKVERVTLRRGGYSFSGCIVNLDKNSVDSDITFKLIEQTQKFSLLDVEKNEVAFDLKIPMGFIEVCFELATPGYTAVGEYFLGFTLSSTNKTYISP